MATINIISHLTNGKGLQRDYDILRNILEANGHTCRGIQYDRFSNVQRADINIIMEVISPIFLSIAKVNLYIPNAEWHPKHYDMYLPQFKYVLCKTLDCLRLFQSLVGEKAVYTGFESSDFYIPEIKREKKFIHIAGDSSEKNTEAIIQAWRSFGRTSSSYGYQRHRPQTSDSQLTLVTSRQDFLDMAKDVPNITCRSKVPMEELAYLMNSHRFHLCPSKYEGWGHYLHEALGVGAIVITTNQPPMSEFSGVQQGMQVPAHIDNTSRMSSAVVNLHTILPENLRAVALQASQLPEERLNTISREARKTFILERREFRERILSLIENL